MSYFSKKMKGRGGFTLIEMLVVIGIIGVLASLTLVGLSGARSGSRDAQRIANLTKIGNVLEVYFLRNNQYLSNSQPSLEAIKTALSGTDSSINNISLLGDKEYYYCALDSGESYVIGVQLEAAKSGGYTGADCAAITCNGGSTEAGYYCINN